MPKKIKEDLPKIELIDNKTVGQRVADLRKKRGLSQVELSEMLGIMRATLSDYELGRSRIFDEMITRIAFALEVTTDRILGKEEIKSDYEEKVPLRYTKRIKEIEKLPEHKKRAVLKTLDDSIKANKF